MNNRLTTDVVTEVATDLVTEASSSDPDAMETYMFEVTENTWALVLGLPIHRPLTPPREVPAPVPASASVPVPGELWTGQVDFSGGQAGAILLTCPSAMVDRAAAVMFDRAASEIDDDARADALGELTNIIAGNLKAVLADGTALSPPSVRRATDERKEPSGGRYTRIELDCDGSPISVGYLER